MFIRYPYQSTRRFPRLQLSLQVKGQEALLVYQSRLVVDCKLLTDAQSVPILVIWVG